jgi:hypothetical protein
MRTGPALRMGGGWLISTRYLPRLRDELREDRVRTALRAALERLEAVRRREAVRACRESARCDAPDRPSRLRALLVARERLVEGRLRRDVCVRLVFFADAVPFGGAGNFTPAFLALESPIAIACFGFRTPCFPSRTWWISSRTNSPACVLGDLPSSASRWARRTVSCSGISPPYLLETFSPTQV